MLSYNEIFNTEKFLRSKGRMRNEFYQKLTETQMFSSFIEAQVLGSTNEIELNYYNQMVSMSKPTIIQPELTQIYIVQLPNSRGIDAKERFRYTQFPLLSDKYLVDPRYINIQNSKIVDINVILYK